MTFESGNLKKVFALLRERITFYVQITIVEIGGLGFKKFIKFVFSFANEGLVSDPLDTSSHELLEEVII